MKNNPETLWLENQICFPIYAASRMVTKLYTPFLSQLDITYPQYLVLLILWQTDQMTVSEISHLVHLESNTLTPVLKRMQGKGLIERQRSEKDERSVIISLTEKGKALRKEAMCIPQQIIDQFASDEINAQEIHQLKQTLTKLTDILGKKEMVPLRQNV
ncbi:MarR family winged helix-turn-helix transcriptional regulator [Reichenbachiella agariperforans]|uniref:MarR family winged helix-turn-helix transcriptional regulator n=1 Tax=Reichenbachiella agariperforans TaxID=156994 RepID=UPI001C09697A|nr:MarR family transcriptional regulator [Reichenbachiella agariperforans]MBU2915711.1 MarR family transcriptional regulator [Reichenbachiella agariperforans]